MEQGWIKSYRKILDNQFLMTDNTAYIVFTKLLHLVNNKHGTFTTGRFALAERVNIKPTTLYKALIRLEDNRLVTLGSNNRFTVITICNWNKYQDSVTAKVTSREQQSNNKVTLNKNKEVRIKKLSTPINFSELEPELSEFVKMRKTLRKPPTDKAIELIVKKLQTWYPDDLPKQKACLNQSIENSWQGVFELREPTETSKSSDRLRKMRERHEAFTRNTG